MNGIGLPLPFIQCVSGSTRLDSAVAPFVCRCPLTANAQAPAEKPPPPGGATKQFPPTFLPPASGGGCAGATSQFCRNLDKHEPFSLYKWLDPNAHKRLFLLRSVERTQKSAFVAIRVGLNLLDGDLSFRGGAESSRQTGSGRGRKEILRFRLTHRFRHSFAPVQSGKPLPLVGQVTTYLRAAESRTRLRGRDEANLSMIYSPSST